MALIKCSECGKKISDKSTVCIHCGCPIENAAIESAEANEKIAVDTENSETAKKVVDKVKLKKIAIIASSVVGAIAIVATLLFFLVLKPAYEEATVVYNDAIAIYNETVATYEAKSTQIATENLRLTTVIDELQGNVSSGEKPYDPDTIPAANTAINEGKIALIDIPKWEDKGVKAAADYNVFQASTMKKDAEKVKAYSVELTGVIESMQVPDHTEVIAVVNKAKEALQFSIQQMKQVTCPSESFVLERVTNIRDQAGMIDVIALTEDNDPENYIGKAGWYTAKIIFRHKDVEHYGLESGLLSLNEVGNPAGGCIEVYRTEEDAQRRTDELKSQEGTARSPGARVICGTMVIRVSDDLKTSYQQELLNLILNEMLRIEQPDQTNQEGKPSQGEQKTPDETISSDKKPGSDSNNQKEETKQEPTTETKPQQNTGIALEPKEYAKELYNLGYNREEIIQDFINGGMPKSDAEKTVDNCGVDWNGEALRIAKEYVEVNPYNEKYIRPDDIKERVLFYFSDTQKEYAVNNCGFDFKGEALRAMCDVVAELPQELTTYSPQGCKDTTLYGFTDSQKNYAIQNCGIDWNDAAVEYTKMLDLNLSNWKSEYDGRLVRKEEMIKELKINGFTEAQAIYGVDNSGIDWASRES